MPDHKPWAIGFALIIIGWLAGCQGPGKSEPLVRATEADRQLALAYEQAAAAGEHTAARESILHARARSRWLDVLKGNQPTTEAALNAIRKYFHEQLPLALAGPTWPAMPALDLPKATGPIILDGRINEPAWQHALTLDGVYENNHTTPAAAPTVWRLLWDQTYLYVAYACDDPFIDAPLMERDEAIYKYDCVELFVLPRFETGRYWELIISPSGSIYDALHTKRFDAFGSVTRLDLDMKGLRIGRRTRGKGERPGYDIEIAVPLRELPEYDHIRPAPGQTLRIMLARMDRGMDGRTEWHRGYTFVPVISWNHNIWNYPTVTLTAADQAK